MARLTLYYPVKPFHVNQHFGNEGPCVIDFGLPTQNIYSPFISPDGVTRCYAGGDKLYPHFGMTGHSGTDLMAGVQAVYAAHDGVVVEKQSVPARGLGLGILTNEPVDLDDHGTHFIKIRYWHLQSFTVEVGDSVKAGQQIGISDNTGYSSGNHLHFEGQPMDKDAGGHPVLALTDSGKSVIANAIDIEPYLNGQYAQDIGPGLSQADSIAVIAAQNMAKGNSRVANILFSLASFLRAFK